MAGNSAAAFYLRQYFGAEGSENKHCTYRHRLDGTIGVVGGKHFEANTEANSTNAGSCTRQVYRLALYQKCSFAFAMQLRQVCVNNLKGVNLDLPCGKLIVFCGRSGSGKTSLAIDTLYAEGQRRYLETFNADTKRFLPSQERPNAELLDGIPPAVAVTSKTFPKSSAHTVGTATEITDYLEQLFAQAGQYFCPQCGSKVNIDSPQSVLTELRQRFRNNKTQRLQIAFTPPETSTPDDLAAWKELGFLRGLLGNTPFRLDEVLPSAPADETILLIVDRLTIETDDTRFIDSLETAMDYGRGRCTVLAQNDSPQTPPLRLNFSRQFQCANCAHSELRSEPHSEPQWNILLDGKNQKEIETLTLTQLQHFLKTFFDKQKTAFPALEQVLRRLEFLHDTGLDYLTLNRSVLTLSSGEQRRIGLTPVLSSSSAGLLCVLDEPTLGLHPKDTEKILTAVQKLRDRDNTVIAVEHNAAFIAAADYLVEFGPGSGENGGNIVAQKARDEQEPQRSETPSIVLSPLASLPSFITLTNCSGHNLQHIDVSFPLGVLCTVTGVSGAGKSSLIQDTLYPALYNRFCNKNALDGLPFDALAINGDIQDVVLLNAESPAKTGRANPATYLKILDEIRSIFAEQPEAQVRNLSVSCFSFNTDEGRCGHCAGAGSITVDMQILPDITVQCPECKGKRYRPEVLEVLYRSKSIADVLTMTAREAFLFFRGHGKVQKRLKFLLDAGLDYLQLGQPLNTLSGGEMQRLKLASHLAQIKKGATLMLMDEPAAGLHREDIVLLLECFRALIQTGHSLIVSEHNAQFVAASDYVIELGPAAAQDGGRIVANGVPQWSERNTSQSER